jgi:G:T-mismatch repair DNA endonuclease (very short patch repair protein)
MKKELFICQWCGSEKIKRYKSQKFCNRSCSISNRNHNLVWTIESRQKVAIKNAKNFSGKNNPNYGGVYTKREDIRKRTSQTRKRKWANGEYINWTDKRIRTPEITERISGENNSFYGHHHDDETKKRIGQTRAEGLRSGRTSIKRLRISDAENEIVNFLKQNNINVKQQFIIDGSTYMYDICVPEKNIIIEYNGDYWHANPKYYDKQYFNKSSELIAEDIWKRDKLKQQHATNNNFSVIVIWEDEYSNNKEKTLNNLLERIKL